MARLQARGGEVRCGTPVERVVVRDGAARGVVLADGTEVPARSVLADTTAPMLYRELVGAEHLPATLVRDLDRFQWDARTVKINWALRAPVPWTAEGARGAGTVHLGVDLAGLTRYAGDLATRTVPENPFLVVGQMTTSDPSRSPRGTESAWCYTHLPERVDLDEAHLARHVERVEAVLERHAPGFGATVLAREVQAPWEFQGTDANLVGGAINNGTAALHQQLVFRPVPGLARAETVVDRLYLASAAAHPGGGVHGGPGSNAARAAILRDGRAGALRRRLIDAAFARIYR
jgi:phytoene dehydrogenase-like protein